MQDSALRLGDLPLDVFRTILSTLDSDDDKPTLSACALLSRTCSNVARPLLFNTVYIYSNELGQIAEFIGRHPDVAIWIKKFRFRRRLALDILDLTILVDVLPNLPSLREVHFGMLILKNFPKYFDIDRPIRLRKLWIGFLLSDGDTIMYPYPTLLSLFSPDCLEMTDSHGNVGDIMPPDYTPVHRPIRRLVLGYGSTTMGGFDFLRAVMVSGQLQSFSVQLYGWPAVRNACAFIRDVGSGLTEVELDVCLLLHKDQQMWTRASFESDAFDWRVFGKALCECDRLESIRVRVPPSRARRYNERININFETRYAVFAGVFSSTRPRSGSSTLRRVIVRIDATFVWDSVDKLANGIELWDLPILDRVLSKNGFPRLETVTVEILVPRERDPKGIGREVMKALPYLGAAGLLRIVNLS